MKKICIWGDSVLKGVVFDELAEKYTVLKENSVALLSEELDLSFENHSKFGLTAPKAQKMMHAYLEKHPYEGYAIIELGGNDCDFNWSEVAANPDALHLPNTPIDQFIQCVSGMVAELREKKITPVLLDLFPLDPERYFQWTIRNGLNGQNILKWLGDVGQIYRYQEGYSLALLNLAKELGCELVDIRQPLLLAGKLADNLCVDGIHPNQRGHRLLKDYFFQYIKKHFPPNPDSGLRPNRADARVFA